MANVAINGLGRIGRATLKILMDTEGLQVVAVNDVAPKENIAYLLRYDTVYGRYDRTVELANGRLDIDGHEIRFLQEKDPDRLPWGELDVDAVIESTGIFTRRADLEKHLGAGARHVVLSAPAKDEVLTVVHGANRIEGEPPAIISCASCTTNSITPVVEVLDRRIGVRKATMTTVHAYTSSQGIVDGPHAKLRRGRAGAANLVPTTTGAALATAQALPQFEGRFNGAAIRAPLTVGSIADIVALTERETSVDELNGVFREEARSERYEGVLGVAEDPIVSADVIGDSRASIVDLEMTQVVDGDLVKVMSWYDNEWGYASQMVREVRSILGA